MLFRSQWQSTRWEPTMTHFYGCVDAFKLTPAAARLRCDQVLDVSVTVCVCVCLGVSVCVCERVRVSELMFVCVRQTDIKGV